VQVYVMFQIKGVNQLGQPIVRQKLPIQWQFDRGIVHVEFDNDEIVLRVIVALDLSGMVKGLRSCQTPGLTRILFQR